MALDFPSAPDPGDTFSAVGKTWKWDGITWKLEGLNNDYTLSAQDGSSTKKHIRLSNTVDTYDVTLVAGQNITLNRNVNEIEIVSSGGSGGSGSSTFTGLNDTPSTFTADKWIKVNSAGNALEWVNEPAGDNTTYGLEASQSGNNPIIRLAGSDNTDSDITLSASGGIDYSVNIGTKNIQISSPENISDLGDVNIVGQPSNNAILKFNLATQKWMLGSDNVSGGGSGVGNLQQVTDQGNTTTNSITTQGLAMGSFDGANNKITLGDNSEATFFYQQSSSEFITQVNNGNDWLIQITPSGSFKVHGYQATEMIVAGDNGTKLYHKSGGVVNPVSSLRLETTILGAKVTGELEAGGNKYPISTGNPNEVLMTNGAGQLSWTAQTGGGGSTTINNNAAERVITGSATANTLNAESNLTLATNGTLTLTGSLIVDKVNINDEVIQLSAGTSNLKIRGNGIGGSHHLTLDDHVSVVGNLELNAGVKDKDGQLGTPGQILSSTGTQLDWIDAPSGATTLNELTDVNVSNDANSDGLVLKYQHSSQKWIAAADLTATGGSGISLTDLSRSNATPNNPSKLEYDNSNGVFTYTPPDLTDLGSISDHDDVTISGPQAGQVLKYVTGTGWINDDDASGDANVKSDWDATSGDAEILNKPTNVSEFTNDAGYKTTDSDTTYTIDLIQSGNTPVADEVKLQLSAGGSGSGTDIISLKAGTDIEFENLNPGGSSEITIKSTAASNNVTKFTDLSDTPGAMSSAAGMYLRINSTENGIEYASVTSGGGGLQNIVEDTTPQLGGNLDVNGKSITSPTGTMYIDAYNIVFRDTFNGSSSYKFAEFNYAGPTTVKLYGGLAERFRTTQSGCKVTGELEVTGDATANLFIGDLQGNADTATNLNTSSASKQLLYQIDGTTTGLLPAGTSGWILQSQGSGNAPAWVENTASGSFTDLSDTPSSHDNGKWLKSNGSNLVWADEPQGLPQGGASLTGKILRHDGTEWVIADLIAGGGIDIETTNNTFTINGMLVLQMQSFSGTGYHYPHAKTKGLLVVLVGGGGGSGSATGNSSFSAGTGGGGGAAAAVYFYTRDQYTNAQNQGGYYSCGAGGAGGVGQNDNGEDGDESTLQVSGTGPTLRASGGKGSAGTGPGNYSYGGVGGSHPYGGGSWPHHICFGVAGGHSTGYGANSVEGEPGITNAPGCSGANWGSGGGGIKSNSGNTNNGNSGVGGRIDIYEF
ncbi:MAG: hypothetical protein CMJ76_00570 [Planctomycetaceae bacterium]|nr:hypothetical protein [Planctomycetaceae bacterium]